MRTKRRSVHNAMTNPIYSDSFKNDWGHNSPPPTRACILDPQACRSATSVPSRLDFFLVALARLVVCCGRQRATFSSVRRPAIILFRLSASERATPHLRARRGCPLLRRCRRRSCRTHTRDWRARWQRQVASVQSRKVRRTRGWSLRVSAWSLMSIHLVPPGLPLPAACCGLGTTPEESNTNCDSAKYFLYSSH